MLLGVDGARQILDGDLFAAVGGWFWPVTRRAVRVKVLEVPPSEEDDVETWEGDMRAAPLWSVPHG